MSKKKTDSQVSNVELALMTLISHLGGNVLKDAPKATVTELKRLGYIKTRKDVPPENAEELERLVDEIETELKKLNVKMRENTVEVTSEFKKLWIKIRKYDPAEVAAEFKELIKKPEYWFDPAEEKVVAKIQKHGIKMRDALAVYRAPIGHENMEKDGTRQTAQLSDRVRKTYIKRIGRLADDLEAKIIPALMYYNPKIVNDRPKLEDIAMGLRNIKAYLGQSEFRNYLIETKKSSRRGPKFSTHLRDIRIRLLRRFFEKCTGKPCNELVAKIVRWESGNLENFSESHVRAAKRRGNIFPELILS